MISCCSAQTEPAGLKFSNSPVTSLLKLHVFFVLVKALALFSYGSM